ncbi:MAG: diphosphate--fructose-6-phosphate 1-phosphotransferase [Dysgonamonadaceae bacterium]|jgi:pyrophosphate--fructose-6-phosphate 1-phosphotransferase|nr:diphosphate--fructose-6-phosphate 1-phosphotransferase [Dysgonamonadaceae bacterium]
MTKSVLQVERAKYQPKMPAVLKQQVIAVDGEKTESVADRNEIKALFPNTYGLPVVSFQSTAETRSAPAVNVGVILSGGQAPGGHNVIAGLFDGIKKANKESRLFGFLLGPGGLLKGNAVELTSEIIDEYRNTGGFDIIGSDRTKLIQNAGHFERALKVLNALKVDGTEYKINALVIIGGDDSNTNACVLAEYFKSIGSDIQVIGCPKTIDGDLKNEQIETSFGFDTACKVYSEVIGNIQRDCNSAKKYWHFIKLMGRSASHIALECALQTHPNFCIVSEEIEEKNYTLDGIVEQIVELVITRNLAGKHFGTALIPEGLIEFIPEIKKLIKELNQILSTMNIDPNKIKKSELIDEISKRLSTESAELYSKRLPESVARQLALDRDSHGNVQVSLIETEKLLADKVSSLLKTKKDEELDALKEPGDEKEIKRIKSKYSFSPQTHFFGYEGRCAAPSNYDADYCYSLGYTAASLIGAQKTGYMSSVRNTTKSADKWLAGGIPITMMMNIEEKPITDSNGKLSLEKVPVIQKALVKLNGAPFREYAALREYWALNDDYVYPGPIQFYGPAELTDQPTMTLHLEQKKK